MTAHSSTRMPQWWNSLSQVCSSEWLAATTEKVTSTISDWVGYGDKYANETWPHNYGTREQEALRKQTQEEAIAQWAGDVRESLLKMNQVTYVTHWRSVIIGIFIISIVYYVLESIRNLLDSIHVQQCTTSQLWHNALAKKSPRHQRRPQGARMKRPRSPSTASSEFRDDPSPSPSSPATMPNSPSHHYADEGEEERPFFPSPTNNNTDGNTTITDAARFSHTDRLRFLTDLLHIRHVEAQSLRSQRGDPDPGEDPILDQIEEEYLELGGFLLNYDHHAWLRGDFAPDDKDNDDNAHDDDDDGVPRHWPDADAIATLRPPHPLDSALRIHVAQVAMREFQDWEDACARWEADAMARNSEELAWAEEIMAWNCREGEEEPWELVRRLRRPVDQWERNTTDSWGPDWLAFVPERLAGVRIRSRRMRGFLKRVVECQGGSLGLGMEDVDVRPGDGMRDQAAGWG